MEIIGAFIVGLLSGTVGAISTGGGLIAVPSLIFMGLSPLSAIATSRLGVLGVGLTSLYKYHKGKAIVWKYLPYFIVLAILAGIVGPKILFHIDQMDLQKIIGISMLCLLPVLVFVKGYGATKQHRHRRHTIPGFAIIAFVMLYGTILGAGGGVFLVNTLVFFFGLTLIEATATGIAAWVVATAVALITFITHGQVSYTIGVPLLIGSMAGGYMGAHLALKNGTTWVKWFLVCVVLGSSIKLLFF